MVEIHSKSRITQQGEVTNQYSTDLGSAAVTISINQAYFQTIPLEGELGNCGGTATLKEIQRLLSIHYITLNEPETKSEKVGGDASVTFRGKSDMGLRSSRWGQQAIDLDCSGKLAQAGLKRVDFDTFAHEDF